jgi:glutathione reductase (NADPH)
MAKQGLRHHPNQSPASVTKHSDGTLSITTASGEEFGPYDQVLFATGRKPLIERLGLDEAGIVLNEQGYIQVNDEQNTNVPGVYALGDVCGHVELTPMAIAAGRRLADRLFLKVTPTPLQHRANTSKTPLQ